MVKLKYLRCVYSNPYSVLLERQIEEFLISAKLSKNQIVSIQIVSLDTEGNNNDEAYIFYDTEHNC